MDPNTNSQEGRDEIQPPDNEAQNNFQTGVPPVYASHIGPPPEPGYIKIPRTSTYPSGGGSGMGAPEKKPGKRRAGILGLMLSAMLILGMLLGGAGAEAVMLISGSSSALAAGASTQVTTAAATITNSSSATLVAQANQATINSIYKTVSPSVVMITAAVTGNSRSGTGTATGTGMVIDNQGNILTNYHVIEGASSIKVQLSDGSAYTATVVGTAPQDDLALIKSDAPSTKLNAVQLGDSSAVQVGDEVIAIGYPYALDLSVTSGIVSGLNRDSSGSTGSRTLTGLIQVDAAINPGNSGGPLLNTQGQVIGINTLIESPVDAFTGVGLSIPINQVKSLLSQLEQGGQVQRPWIGISGTDITASLQQQYNLPVSKGILVMDVTAGSPAAAAGLQASTIASSGGLSQGTQAGQIGDIIVAIDGQQIGSAADLTNYLNGKQPGNQVTLTIMRNGQQQKVTVTLQAWAANTSTASSSS
jgi:S1-C subfamily serine protease